MLGTKVRHIVFFFQYSAIESSAFPYVASSIRYLTLHMILCYAAGVTVTPPLPRLGRQGKAAAKPVAAEPGAKAAAKPAAKPATKPAPKPATPPAAAPKSEGLKARTTGGQVKKLEPVKV